MLSEEGEFFFRCFPLKLTMSMIYAKILSEERTKAGKQTRHASF